MHLSVLFTFSSPSPPFLPSCHCRSCAAFFFFSGADPSQPCRDSLPTQNKTVIHLQPICVCEITSSHINQVNTINKRKIRILGRGNVDSKQFKPKSERTLDSRISLRRQERADLDVCLYSTGILSQHSSSLRLQEPVHQDLPILTQQGCSPIFVSHLDPCVRNKQINE